jgi:hypothetical protein
MKLINITAGFAGLALTFDLADGTNNGATISVSPKFGADPVEVISALREAADTLEKFALDRLKAQREERQRALDAEQTLSKNTPDAEQKAAQQVDTNAPDKSLLAEAMK